jgi:Isocitrate/isopropylmalate dehydrogenase
VGVSYFSCSTKVAPANHSLSSSVRIDLSSPEANYTRDPIKIAVLPGDGIGSEIIAEAVKVLRVLDLPLETKFAPEGGTAYEERGHPWRVRSQIPS